MDDLKKRVKAMKAMTPKKGFNVVGLDDYEPAGEELYLIANHPTQEAAEKAKTKYLKANPGSTVYVYGPATKND